MNIYEVTAKCGHVGRDYYVIKSFAVYADSAKEAAKIARKIPRVKHDQPDAIIDVKKIDFNRYEIIRERNANDPYLCCKNIQEQRKIEDLDIFPEVNYRPYLKEERWWDRPAVFRKKKRIRNLKKYINRNVGGDSYEFETA